MKLLEIKFADLTLVEIKNQTPHCKKHGAMNKITNFEDDSGYWRCLSVVSKNNETVCRAGVHLINK